MTALCPVCLQPVRRTAANNVSAHTDTVGYMCPAVGEPFRIALTFVHRGAA